MAGITETYKKVFLDKGFDRVHLFEVLGEQFGISKALYLGSHIHIAPSLVFPITVYIDSYNRAAKLFNDFDMKKYIVSNKMYKESSVVKFVLENYTKDIYIDTDFDLLISQYAVFVSQAGKKYLKSGGILVANNSHGDASMANLDDDYEFIAVANHTNYEWRLSPKELGDYFIPKSGKHDSKDALYKSMRKTGYTKTAANYIFKKR